MENDFKSLIEKRLEADAQMLSLLSPADLPSDDEWVGIQAALETEVQTV